MTQKKKIHFVTMVLYYYTVNSSFFRRFYAGLKYYNCYKVICFAVIWLHRHWSFLLTLAHFRHFSSLYTFGRGYAALCGILFLTAGLPAHAQGLEGETIQVCGDGAEWPPYTFFKREDGNKTAAITGFDVDVLNYIFSKQGIKVKFALIPWNRCLKLTEVGGQYQIALSSAYNKERAAKFLMTRDYYKIRPYYFYSKKKYPEGMYINRKEDFRKYNVCGLYAYNYANFNIPLEKIDQGAKDFDSVINKTYKGRCDLFLARYEIIVGFGQIGINYLERGLGYAPMPGAEPDKFHMLISKNYKHANQLKKIIDDGITEMERSGELEKTIEKYNHSAAKPQPK